MGVIRILIADDHALFRDGLRAMLAGESGIAVVGEAGDAETAVRLARELAPDLILMDLQMPQRSGVDAIREIVARQPAVRILVLTMYQDDEVIAGAVRAGAAGYMLKDSRAAELQQAIRAVASGGAAVAPAVASRLFSMYRKLAEAEPASGAPDLSEREIKILEYLAAGLANRAIAGRLYLSEQTVKNLLSEIYRKLGVQNRTEAVMTAVRLGVIKRTE